MKKILVAIAIVAVAGINVYNSAKDNFTQLSDLQMENIEMLAEGEAYYSCDGNPYCQCFHGSFPGVPKIGYITDYRL